MLSEKCEKHACDSGAIRLDLKTEHNNLIAKALYEKVGFRADDVYQAYSLHF